MEQLDACTLLDDDHNEVIRLFERYKAAHENRDHRLLGAQICRELIVHMQIEEEIFYPAFGQASGNDDLVQEGTREHNEARELINRIEQSQLDARLMLELEDAILHHVNDERDKMFPKARATKGLDLADLAQRLQLRKSQLKNALAA